MAAPTDRSGTVTGSAQVLMAENPKRKWWALQAPPDEALNYALGKTATADGLSYRLAAGEPVSDGGDDVFKGEISVIGTTAGKKFAATEG